MCWQGCCSLPPSGRDWLKTPSTVSQELPSPPHTRHLSSFASEPRTRSQPTCWKKEQRGISEPGGALSSHTRAAVSQDQGTPWALFRSPPLPWHAPVCGHMQSRGMPTLPLPMPALPLPQAHPKARLHLALPIDTDVVGVLPARRPIHHGCGSLRVEVEALSQAVEGTGFHTP